MNPNILNEVLCRAVDLGWWPVQEQGVCGCKGLEAMSRMNLDRSQPQNLQPELLLMKARSESHGARTQRRPALADWLQLFDLRIFLCSSEKELQSAPENHQLLCGIDQPSTTSSQICLKLQALPSSPLGHRPAWWALSQKCAKRKTILTALPFSNWSQLPGALVCCWNSSLLDDAMWWSFAISYQRFRGRGRLYLHHPWAVVCSVFSQLKALV